MNASELNQWLAHLITVLAVCLLMQLSRYRLARQYSWLFAYYLADILQALLAARSSTYSVWYGGVYFAGQAAKTALAAGFSIQLWKLALRAYPALARFGQRFGIYIQIIAAAVAATGLLLNPPRGRGQAVFPHYFNAFEGAADSMIFLFLLSATVFLLWFPVKVSRNTALFWALFVFSLFKNWAILLLLNLYPLAVNRASLAELLLDSACLIWWTIAIRPRGENLETLTGHRWNPAETQRLLGQLSSINARLSQIAHG